MIRMQNEDAVHCACEQRVDRLGRARSRCLHQIERLVIGRTHPSRARGTHRCVVCALFQHIEERSAAKETKTYIPQIMW